MAQVSRDTGIYGTKRERTAGDPPRALFEARGGVLMVVYSTSSLLLKKNSDIFLGKEITDAINFI